MEKNNNKKNKSFSSILKNIFFLLIILQFAPIIFNNIKTYFKKAVTPKTYVGKLTIRDLITDSSFYVKNIKKFYKNDEIKALFLKIDCPGATPGASQAVFEEINRFKEKKPVIVLTENVCASGGYYMAAAANKIIAPASALIGSIGVYLQIPNVKELLNKWNIKFNLIQSGEYKTAGNPFKESDPKEIKYLQSLSDQNYKQFVKDMAKARNLNIAKEKVWANGKVFLATKAKRLKLIDEIGSQSKAEEILKELANIKTKIKFLKPKRPTGLMKLLVGNDELEGQGQGFSSKLANFFSNLFYKIYLNISSKENVGI
ncbi:signal peptide peptidase SppA [Candidatus Dependentiae bacterium]|nr:signal peptide peptidase SppA [Candidatus Dependentiae bacterium]